MFFPEVPRVIYQKNPLNQVIAQLRYSPILKMDVEAPYGFQEDMGGIFPELVDSGDMRVEIMPGQNIPASLPNMAKLFSGVGGHPKKYDFSSDDGNWKASLTRAFLALTCLAYERWEGFLERLEPPLTSLIRHYNPPQFTRVGLRYINVIRRSELGLEGFAWSDLIKPPLLGLLQDPEASRSVTGSNCHYDLVLEQDLTKLRLVTRLVRHVEDDEICFMIDADFYTEEKVATSDVRERLTLFNVNASKLIQWCITSRLHEAMEPQEA